MPHYEFTGVERELGVGRIVKQIRAVVDLPDLRTDLLHLHGAKSIQAGDVGGWIESESVVGRSGVIHPRLGRNSWVADSACVYGHARLQDEARAEANALVYGHAELSGQAVVAGDARVYGRAILRGAAIANGHSVAFDNAVIEDNGLITDSAVVCQDARVAESARVGGNARIRGSAVVMGNTNVFGLATVDGQAIIAARTTICGIFEIAGYAHIEATDQLLVVHPIGSRQMSATVFYRTASGRGEVAHRFEQPWHGNLREFRLKVSSFLRKLDTSDARRPFWRAQYEAFDALATLAEQRWVEADSHRLQ